MNYNAPFNRTHTGVAGSHCAADGRAGAPQLGLDSFVQVIVFVELWLSMCPLQLTVTSIAAAKRQTNDGSLLCHIPAATWRRHGRV